MRSITALFAVCLLLFSCISLSQTPSDTEEQVVRTRTYFYTQKGDTTLVDTSFIWYRDSATIQEFHEMKTIRSGGVVTHRSYPPIRNRYIDLRTRIYYDYLTLTDTAKIIQSGPLPDSIFTDYGWSYFSEKVLQIQGEPEMLSDTIIGGLIYKRAKLTWMRQDPKRNFTIGYWRCDGKGELFSEEKQLSRRLGCTMTKTYSYQNPFVKPYASREVDFISDKVPEEKLKLFVAWKKNARTKPVKLEK